MFSPACSRFTFCRNLIKIPFISIKLTRPLTLVKMTTQGKWKIEKNRILNLSLEDKRKLYKGGNYVTLNQIDIWPKYAASNNVDARKHTLDDETEFAKIQIDTDKNSMLAEKVSIFRGDITKLEIDAIVNAANSLLRAGGGVDGAIHRAAGPLLQEECNSLNGCPTGDAKVAGGYNLPAKYVIHTVGPQDGSERDLQSCYDRCLAHQQEYKLKSIAFPCISTGIYGFPNRLASHIALRTARQFLEKNSEVDRIIFCTFMPVDVEIYETLMQMYFPWHNYGI